MDCTQTQRHLHDLGTGRLSDPVTRTAQRHLAECTDCRVAQQRALHLQQLFSVKRHETPGAQYFDNFLGDFHQRLTAELAPRPTWFQRLCARFHIEPVAHLRYSYAHALGVVMAMALIWRGLIASQLPERVGQHAGLETGLAAAVTDDSQSTPRKIAADLPARTVATAAQTALNTFVLPAEAHADFTSPRYVLDRIAVTPVSYAANSIQF